MTLFTTPEVAAKHNTYPSTVLRLARALGMKPTKIIGKAWMWTPTQAARLKPGPRGRPKKGRKG